MKDRPKQRQICVSDLTGELSETIQEISEEIKLKQPEFIKLDDYWRSQLVNNRSVIIRLSVEFLLNHLKQLK